MFIEITMYIAVLAIFFTSIRLIIGPTVWDRLLALNLISAKVVLLIALLGIYNGDLFFIDIALTFALIEFLGVTLLAKFIQEGGRHK